MPSYIVTGASRGLSVSFCRTWKHCNSGDQQASNTYIGTLLILSPDQYGFIKTFASDASNTVIGIVRNKAATE
jgi:hypothetical protein